MIHIKNLMVTLVHDQMALDRIIRWVELLLVIVLAIALARLVADLIPPASVIPEAPQLTQQVSDRQQFGADPIRTSPAMLQLFGVETASTDMPVAIEQPLQQTSLNLTLKGILADQGTDNRFALIAVAGQKEKVYRVGDKVEGADILRIEPRRVVIRRNGVTEALDLEVRKLSGTTGTKKTFTERISMPGKIRRISDTERVIPLSMFKQQMSNLPALLQQASAVPQINDGRPVGFRIVSINQGSMFEQLGIRQNDVIHTVNDIPIRNVGDAMNAYRTLSGANSFRVGVIRNGQDIDLNLSIQ